MIKIIYVIFFLIFVYNTYGATVDYSHQFPSPIRTIDYKGQKLAFGLDNGEVYIHDINKIKESTLLGKHQGRVNQVKWSHDGKSVISCSNDGTVRLWKIESQDQRIMREHEGAVFAVAIHPDGEWIASGGIDSKVILWNTETNDIKVMNKHKSAVWSLDFNKNGTILASGGGEGDNSVILWKISNNLTLKPIEHKHGIYSVRFSNEGTEIITSSMDQSIKVWQILNKQVIHDFQFKDIIYFSETLDDAHHVLYLKKTSMALYQKDARKEDEEVFYKHNEPITSYFYSKNDHYLAIGDEKGNLNIISNPLKKKSWKIKK